MIANSKPVTTLLSSATSAQVSDFAPVVANPAATFQATGATTSGSGAASVSIQVSNDQVGWVTIGTISLSLTTSPSSDGFALAAKWGFARATLVSISGTGASVTVTMGV